MSDIVEELFASDDASALTNRAGREIERLTARVAELEEGLKPFAANVIVSIEDVRRARALLSKGGDHAG